MHPRRHGKNASVGVYDETATSGEAAGIWALKLVEDFRRDAVKLLHSLENDS